MVTGTCTQATECGRCHMLKSPQAPLTSDDMTLWLFIFSTMLLPHGSVHYRLKNRRKGKLNTERNLKHLVQIYNPWLFFSSALSVAQGLLQDGVPFLNTCQFPCVISDQHVILLISILNFVRTIYGIIQKHTNVDLQPDIPYVMDMIRKTVFFSLVFQRNIIPFLILKNAVSV